VYCAHCGKELVEGANFCSTCGARAGAAGRVAAAEGLPGKAPEATGGVSAALASGRSRSRLHMPPIILLALALALTAGIAAAAYYVYTEVYLPSAQTNSSISYDVAAEESSQNAPAAENVPLAENSPAAESAPPEEDYHFDSNHYGFDLPNYWRGRVIGEQDGDTTVIYPKAAYDAGYRSWQLARISLGDEMAARPGGDVSSIRIFAEEYQDGQYVITWATTPALFVVSMMISDGATLEESMALMGDDAPLDLVADYVDLSSGGILGLDDLTVENQMKVTEQSCYARSALPPLIGIR